MTEPHWTTRAACTLADTTMFTLAMTSNTALRDARSRCYNCPVLHQCEAETMAMEGPAKTSDREEFRAGMTPRERSVKWKRQQTAAREAALRREQAAIVDSLEAAADSFEDRLLSSQIADHQPTTDTPKGSTA